ncbi:hypothetical protein [Paraclostridium sordellii]
MINITIVLAVFIYYFFNNFNL